jgi:hypothetical protein
MTRRTFNLPASAPVWLTVLGTALLFPNLYALVLGDLRQYTVEFEILFFGAFALYAAASLVALRIANLSFRMVITVFILAVAIQGILVFTRPTLSDDMYRYVWDGRVQAQGISPYLYPPDAPQLAYLRDPAVWDNINRKPAGSVYQPVAEILFALLWRIWPDNIHWFQAGMLAAGVLAGALLAGLLRDMGRSAARLVIYLWSPLLAFEVAHSAHVDAWVLPLLVGAWWARWRQRDSLVGCLLALATAIKFYPAVLLPILWRRDHPQGRWRMPLAFGLTLVVVYLPALVGAGTQPFSFLPDYFREHFNVAPPVEGLLSLFAGAGTGPQLAVTLLTLAALAFICLVVLARSPADAETAIRSCVWPIGVMTILSHDLFSWYMLWLLPLLAIFLRPGRLLGFRLDAWSGWWLFCGLIGLSYTFFISWTPVPAAIWAQFLPLYALLLADLGRRLKEHELGRPAAVRQSLNAE